LRCPGRTPTVKLLPISPQYLRIHEPLPFGLRDADGRLLLAAGQLIGDRAHLNDLTGQPLFAGEDATEWTRRLSAARDAMIRQGASLQAVAAAMPEAPREQARPLTLSFSEQWLELVSHLDVALRDIRNGPDWRNRLMSVHSRARQLTQKRLDASIYHLVYEAAVSNQKYSCSHALLTMVVCEQAAPLLGWEPAWIDSLGRAALTMNVAMLRLQDQLANSLMPPNAEARVVIDGHAAAGAELLEQCKLDDPLATAVVALHHDGSEAELALSVLPPERQLARLLRRVDIFTAKISRRASRPPASPVQAAREACLGANGVPDEIGAALLKAVGLYPPGSFVELVSGEVGIVVARGRRANLPVVASLVAPSGIPLGEPVLRDTIDRRHAVKTAVAASLVKVRPPHERLLAMRG
jgi:HD-GYP domain-containing protein (c-di-GMP phosphodiesterase class II)